MKSKLFGIERPPTIAVNRRGRAAAISRTCMVDSAPDGFGELVPWQATRSIHEFTIPVQSLIPGIRHC
jgi:hypothetical protein